MGSDEEKQKRKSRMKRNAYAKALEDKKYRQRKISKDYKKLKAKLESDTDDDLHSD